VAQPATPRQRRQIANARHLHTEVFACEWLISNYKE
jgi:hypothetical protein